MNPPVEPKKEDCCNSGCNPCIFDVYEKQLRIYEKYLSGEVQPSNYTENAISQLDYTPFLLQKNEKICDSHVLLAFKRLMENEKRKLWWKPGNHFLFKYISGETTCTRAYTPIKSKNCSDLYDFTIIVKICDSGLVSNHLAKLNIGDETLWRGPYGSYVDNPDKYKRIIMIAQGTGIAPFYSIIENILDNDDDMTKIHLYYCVKSADCILFRDEFYSYKQFWNFSYKVFLSSFARTTNYKYQEPIIHHKLEYIDFKELKPFSTSDHFLLCGSTRSTHFMEDIKSILLKTGNVVEENILLF